jgi:prephenate dehydratase
LPVLGKEWTYFMYADLEFDHLTQFEDMVKVLEPVVFEFVILGEYTQAIKIN